MFYYSILHDSCIMCLNFELETLDPLPYKLNKKYITYEVNNSKT